MAEFKALVLSTGNANFSQIPSGSSDYLDVGDGLLSRTTSLLIKAGSTGTKTIQIGEGGSGETVNIGGTSGTNATVNIWGDLNVEGNEVITGSSTFVDAAVFKGAVTFGHTDSPNPDTITFESTQSDIISDIYWGPSNGTGRYLRGRAPRTGDEANAGTPVGMIAGDAGSTNTGDGADVTLQPGAPGGGGSGSYGSVYFGNTGGAGDLDAYQIMVNNGGQAGIRYNDSTDVWEIRNDSGGWTTIAAGSVIADGSNTYDRLYWNGSSWASSPHLLLGDSTSTDRRIYFPSAGGASTAGVALDIDGQTGGTEAAGGAITIDAGVGGAAAGTGAGGTGGTLTIGAGGGGAGDGSNAAGGGGNLGISAGDAGTATSTGGLGGSITVTTGSGTGALSSGSLSMKSANGTSTGASGGVSLSSGTTGSGASGDVSIYTGASSGTGNTGDVNLYASASSSGTAGAVRPYRNVEFYDGSSTYARVNFQCANVTNSSSGYVTGTRFGGGSDYGMVWEYKSDGYTITQETSPSFGGGSMTFRGGNGVTSGGTGQLKGGTAGSGVGGSAVVQAGSSAGAAAGGQVVIGAGSGVGDGYGGGDVLVSAGDGSGTVSGGGGGNITLTAGDGDGTNAPGGGIDLVLGTGTGIHVPGYVLLGPSVASATADKYQILCNTTSGSYTTYAGIRYNHSDDSWEVRVDNGTWVDILTSSSSANVEPGDYTGQVLLWNDSTTTWENYTDVTLYDKNHVGSGQTVNVEIVDGDNQANIKLIAQSGDTSGQAGGGTYVEGGGGAGTGNGGHAYVLGGNTESGTDGNVYLGETHTTEVQFGGTESVQIDFMGNSGNRVISDIVFDDGAVRTIKMEDGDAGTALYLQGQNGSTGAGGDLHLVAGSGAFATAGGDLYVSGGASVTGTDGTVNFNAANGSSVIFGGASNATEIDLCDQNTGNVVASDIRFSDFDSKSLYIEDGNNLRSLTLYGQSAASGNTDGGTGRVRGGAASGTGTGGTAILAGGTAGPDATTGGDGGDVQIIAADGANAVTGGDGGSIDLQPGTGGTGGTPLDGWVNIGNSGNADSFLMFLDATVPTKPLNPALDGIASAGVRSNSGIMEYKDTGGNWTAFNASGGAYVNEGTIEYQHLEWNNSTSEWDPVENITLPEGTRSIKVEDTTTTDTDGGDLTIEAGDADGAGTGGRITIRAGESPSAAGDGVYIYGGASSGSGTGGGVQINGGASTSGTDGTVILGNVSTDEIQFGSLGANSVNINFMANSANRAISGLTWADNSGSNYAFATDAATGTAGTGYTWVAGLGGDDSNGGIITITSGSGGDASATGGGVGGTLSLTGGSGGDGSGALAGGTGADVDVTAGAGGSPDTGSGGGGGDLNLTAGAGNTDGTGGAAVITGGASGSGTAGSVTITGGATTTGATAGNVFIDAGAAGGGPNGYITIGATNASLVRIGNATNYAYFDVDGSPPILAFNGTTTINLPGGAATNNFQIQGSAVSDNVTAANLNTLTAGSSSNADSLHTHSGLAGTVSFSGTSGEALSAGAVLSNIDASGTAKLYGVDVDSATSGEYNPVGFALAAATGADETISVAVAGEITVSSLWDDTLATTDVGKLVYASPTADGNVTINAGSFGSGDYRIKVGVITEYISTSSAKIVIQIGDAVYIA